MKEEMVSIAELKQHPDYIRGQHSKGYVTELATTLKESGWVFPPVELQPITTTEKIYAEGFRYYILDGTHRVACAIEAEYTKKIPARIHPPLTSLDAIAEQLRLNQSHGLRLSVSAQTNAILKLKELGMKGKIIAEKTGLSETTISRIVGGKQRGANNPEGKPGGSSEGRQAAARKSKPFKTEDWLKGLARVLKAWKKHGTKIRKANFPDPCGKAMDTLTEALLDKEE